MNSLCRITLFQPQQIEPLLADGIGLAIDMPFTPLRHLRHLAYATRCLRHLILMLYLY